MREDWKIIVEGMEVMKMFRVIKWGKCDGGKVFCKNLWRRGGLLEVKWARYPRFL